MIFSSSIMDSRVVSCFYSSLWVRCWCNPGKLNKCSYGYFSFLENKFVLVWIFCHFSHNDSACYLYLYMTENMLIKKTVPKHRHVIVSSCLPFASTDDCRIMEIMKHNIKCIYSFFFFLNPFTESFVIWRKEKKSDINTVQAKTAQGMIRLHSFDVKKKI